MSVSLGIYKGKAFECSESEFRADIPVSFQRVWDSVWENAIVNCNVQILRCSIDFTIKQIPEVISELELIYDWVQTNRCDDSEYVLKRIRDELCPFLKQFYAEHKDEDYWFTIG